MRMNLPKSTRWALAVLAGIYLVPLPWLAISGWQRGDTGTIWMLIWGGVAGGWAAWMASEPKEKKNG